MFLLVLAGAKRRSEISKFQFLTSASIEGLLHSAAKKVRESAGVGCLFPIYFAVLNLVFKLKQNFKPSHILKKNLINHHN